MIIRCLHTQTVHIRLSIVYLFRIFNGEKVYRVSAAGSRIQGPFYGISEIFGCDRRTVGPEGVFPQVEGPYPVVLTHLIGLGSPVLYLAVLIKSEQLVHCGRGIGKPAQGNGACRIQGSRVTADGDGNLLLSVRAFAAVLKAACQQPRRQRRGQKNRPQPGQGPFCILPCSPSFTHVVSPF